MLSLRGASLSEVEKRDADVEHLQKLLNEKPSEEMARLRLGFEGEKREVLRLRKKVEDLKVEANKARVKARFLKLWSMLNAKLQDLIREKEQLELWNASLRRQVDGETEVKAEFARMLDEKQWRFHDRVAVLDSRLDKMAKETDEEFAPMLRDAKVTKEFLDLSDMSFHLLEQVEACANQPFSYLEALLVMGVHEDVQDEARTFTNLASGSTSSVGGVTDQFPVVPSVSYAGDPGATAQSVTLADEVATIETDVVLTGTAIDDNAAATLATTPDVSGSNPAALTVTMPSPFQ
ncbi:hypothetical protein Tco_0214078 [Tanacetum coccineum]